MFDRQPHTARNWIQTASGRQFFPLDPQPEEVFIEDIAHGLAHMCRFNGHTKSFYSVAQHSVIVASILPPELALWGLLHDASEAYVADITRPVKPYLTNYGEIEERIMEAVAQRFGLTWPMPPEVKTADVIALSTEKRDVMGPAPAMWAKEWQSAPLEYRIKCWSPGLSRRMFLTRFNRITGASK